MRATSFFVLGLACALALPAAANADATATVLVENVHGASVDAQGRVHRFGAMLVDEGKVLALAADRAALQADPAAAARLPAARVHDGGGRYLLPGLIDAHGHLGNLGKLRTSLDLVGVASREDALARVRDYARAHAHDAWLLGRGWNEQLWPDKSLPTASQLDGVVADRPAWFRRVDGHAGWANHAALQAAGIDRDTPDPPGGRIERDARGEPTGVLVDGALDLLEQAIPERSDAQLAAGLDAALHELATVGLTGVGDPGIDRRTYGLYKQYADAGRLSTRIYALVGEVGEDFDAIAVDGPLRGYGRDRLQVNGVKLYADGALGSRGAALLAPYADAPGHSGLLFLPAEALAAKMEKAFAKGFQVGVHAIGDAGNRAVLDAFEQAYRAQPQARALHNRIEHAQVVALDDIARFRELDLVASMQPTHATSDMNMAEDRVGPERLRGAYAWRRFLDQGTRVAGGSDFPVESSNSFWGIHAAVTRQDHAGQPPGGWHPEQAMTRAEALRAFTLDAAYAVQAEARVGSLEPGKWADFVLVDRDLFSVPASDIWKLRVLETWVGGERVYAAP
jgi:predicted amidohydrolase YtcJ